MRRIAWLLRFGLHIGITLVWIPCFVGFAGITWLQLRSRPRELHRACNTERAH